jgi:hypothetical protein
MKLLVCSHNSYRTADALKATRHLDRNTFQVSVNLFVLTENHHPAGRTPSLALGALEQMNITIGVLNNGIAEHAVTLFMMAFIVCRLVADGLAALSIWTRKFSEAAIDSCMPLYHLSFHFLLAASTVVRAFDD